MGQDEGMKSATVCKDGQAARYIRSREALVRDGGLLTPISEYRPSSSMHSFADSWFRTFTVSGTGEIAVGHDHPAGNQAAMLDQKCVVLPISINNNDRGEPEDCIAFFFDVPKLVVELSWDTANDLDLYVRQPHGGSVWWGGEISASGGHLLHDDTSNSCRTSSGGSEMIYYGGDSIPEKGYYNLEIRQFDNCSGQSTNWRLKAREGSRIVGEWKGTANLGNNSMVDSVAIFYQGAA